MEVAGKEWRTTVGLSYQILFAVGYMLQSPIAYQWHDWHDFMVRFVSKRPFHRKWDSGGTSPP